MNTLLTFILIRMLPDRYLYMQIHNYTTTSILFLPLLLSPCCCQLFSLQAKTARPKYRQPSVNSLPPLLRLMIYDMMMMTMMIHDKQYASEHFLPSSSSSSSSSSPTSMLLMIPKLVRWVPNTIDTSTETRQAKPRRERGISQPDSRCERTNSSQLPKTAGR